ncbi:protein IMPACT-like [Saccostrea cucullata]|uniref:protein IMPACT-like n=1 Tax=Saccostrea cuccullata TaxID=36930 RepID=UPI002ED1577B
MASQLTQSKKRALDDMDTNTINTSTSDEEISKECENFQMRDVMHGITNIQNTLANLLLRIDGQGRHLDEVTKDIRGKHGIQERLENVQEQANDTIYITTELQEKQKKMERELSRMKDYIVRLEYCVKIQSEQILELRQSKTVYREKIGSRPMADEIISGEEVKIAISTGKTTEDNGNRFAAHATPVDSYKQVRRSLVEVMRTDNTTSASHNIYAFRFTSNDGTIHEGSEDDGEHGAGRMLLKTLTDNDINNALVVVSRWCGSKIGPRRFTHITEVGMSAARNMPVPV